MLSQHIDQATAIREGEELAAEQLEAYLKEALGLTGSLEVAQFPSGFSNLTYLLELGDKAMVMRRPPFGAKIKSGHDMSREYRVLSQLNPVYPKAPRPLLYCEDSSIIGSDFYVMERVQGVILRSRMPASRVPEAQLMRAIGTSLIDALAELHAIDLVQAGLHDFGRPEGYVARQIKGWTRRYQQAQTDEVKLLDETADWLADHMPISSGSALIHNDFKYDNVVLDPQDWTQIIAILDWEMSTVGDPLMDLGTSLGYWVEAGDDPLMQKLALSPTALPGNPSRAEVIERYQQASGREVSQPVFYYAYGLYKVAVIIQQIYARYRAGLTRDARFAELNHAVQAIARMAAKAIETDSV